MLVGCLTPMAVGVMSPILDGPGFPSSLGDGRPTTTVLGSVMAGAGTGGQTMTVAVSVTGEHFTEAVDTAVLVALASIPGAP